MNKKLSCLMALILALALPSGAAVLTEKALAEEIPAAEAAEENTITFTTYTLEGRLYISGFSCKTVPETLTIPSKINGVSVYGVEYGKKSDIGDMSFGAFDLKGVKNLVIEDGIRYLTFFSGTQNLESVTLPASVEAVVSSCFYGAKKLKSINLENVKRIGSFAFCGCKSLTEVNLSGAEKIGIKPFDEIEDLTIAGHTGTEAEKYALENNMKFRVLQDGAAGKTTDSAAEQKVTFTTGFIDDKFCITGFSCSEIPETLVIPSEINGAKILAIENSRTDENGEFRYAPVDLRGVRHLVIEDGIERIYELSGTENLETVTLPSSVDFIGMMAFSRAEKLKSINLENVKRICSYAFFGCKSLTEVNLNGTEKLGELVFGGTENLTIAGHMSTAGEKYALENRMKFRLLRDNAPPRPITVDGIEYDASESDSLGLFKLGLMKGVSVGEDGKVDFDLFRTPSRVEAVTMLVRLLGKDAAAAEMGKTHPFTDVPAWADGYVSYAYENGLTKGVSDTLFDSDSVIATDMYLTFMLRALGYSDTGENPDFSWDKPWAIAIRNEITERGGYYNVLLRSEMTDISYRTLLSEVKGTGKKLYERMIDGGIFTAEQWEEAKKLCETA